MDNKEFKKNALRTESNDFEKIRERLTPITVSLLIDELRIITDVVGNIDEIKKHIFYGKDSAFLNRCIQFRKDHNLVVRGRNTESKTIKDSEQLIRVLHGIVGIATEAGELVEALLKGIETGSIDTVNVMEESGDLSWYEAIISDALGFEMDDANEKVINKLKARYSEKFTEQDAVDRDLDVERKILEENNLT